MEWRFAVPDDIPTLAELNRQFIQDEGHRNPMTVAQLEERMRGWLVSGEYRAVLFYQWNELVAYALYRESDDEIYLRHFFVVRGRRREGIGRRAMDVLVHNVWPKDKRLTVSVLTPNTPAIAFWRAMGYKDYSLTLEIMPEERADVAPGQEVARKEHTGEHAGEPTTPGTRASLPTLTGRCLCGAVRYAAYADPEAMAYCHCDDCRRVTGSAFGVSVCVPAWTLQVSGEVKAFVTEGEGGHRTHREFCPICGSPLFTRYPDKVYIKAGTIDNAEHLKPTRQIWTEMAVPWSRIPDDIESYPRDRTAK